MITANQYRDRMMQRETNTKSHLRLLIRPSESASLLQYTTAFPGYVARDDGTSTISERRMYRPDAF